MKLRQLGFQGPKVSSIGLGCNRMSLIQPRDDKQSIKTIQASIDSGINFLNTADFYGSGHNESLISKAIEGRRDEVFLSVKCGAMFGPNQRFMGLDGRPESIKNFASYTLQRLNTEVIDLYQPCRCDPDVPYEETIGAIKDLIDDGKVRYLGVSEVGSELLKRAHAVHPVSALEVEYSSVCRFIEKDILPTARELGVSVVPYRILADGILTASAQKQTLSKGQMMYSPRLVGDNYDHNMSLAYQFTTYATKIGLTPAQLALVWLLHQGKDIVPLVGMTTPKHLQTNINAVEFKLNDQQLSELNNLIPVDSIKGERYAPALMPFVAN